MKRFSLHLLLLLMTFTGCQPAQQEGHKNMITLNLQGGDPATRHPYMGVDLSLRSLSLALFEPLMRSDAAGNLSPAAALSVDIDPSEKVYTFHIRPHRWSDGTAVTSHHFEKAWKYALTPGSPCLRADLFYPIKNGEKVKKGEMPLETLGIQAPDPQTLIVTLEYPTPFFLNLTASPFFAPLYDPSEAEPKFFNGPYLVKSWIPDQSMTLAINPFYWDAKELQLDEICFTMVRDPTTAFSMFEQGKLDLVGDPLSSLPFDVIPSLESRDDLHRKTISRIFYLILNTDKPPLHLKTLRKALSLCIDRQLLTEHLFFGQVPTVSCLPQPLSDLEDQQIQEDPLMLFESALAELQTDREHFPPLVLSYAELSGQKKLAEFIQQQWQEKLGIHVDIVCSEWNVHVANLKKGAHQIGTFYLATLYPDPMFYFDIFRNKQSLCNFSHWESPTLKSLLEASEQTTDSALRHDYMQKAESYLLEEMPAIPLFTQRLQYLKQKDIHLEISDLGIYDFKHAYVQ